MGADWIQQEQCLEREWHEMHERIDRRNAMQIRKAVRRKSKLRLGIVAPSGAGKTYSALLLAFGLGGKVGMIDTENGSGDLYANLGNYDIINITAPYTVQKYREAIRAFEDAGYATIIIDSLSHAWAGEGGLLDKQGKIADSGKGNSYAAWRTVTPEHNALVESILQSPCHVIATMRAKQEYVQEKDDRTGKTTIKKVGLAPVQRDGMEYEMSIVLDIDINHVAHASKDRTSQLDGQYFTITIDTGRQLLDWLESGEDPKPLPVQHAGMDESAIIDHLIAINDATTIGELKTAYSTAFRAGNAADDVVALGRFDLAKESRKAALSDPAARSYYHQPRKESP